MAKFIYEGPGHELSLAGQTLTQGTPIDLSGRAAEAASLHPDVRPYTGGASGGPSYGDLKARAQHLGIPVTGNKADLAAAITAEEERLAADAQADGVAGDES